MPLFQKGTRLYSICNLKCPRCQEGDLFPTGSFSFKRPFDMYDRCPNCNLNYWPEPGYYYGAMFISYIISGWFCILSVLFMHWVLDLSMTVSFAILIGFIAIVFVWFFRFSRSVWISMNYKYDPNWMDKETAER